MVSQITTFFNQACESIHKAYNLPVEYIRIISSKDNDVCAKILSTGSGGSSLTPDSIDCTKLGQVYYHYLHSPLQRIQNVYNAVDKSFGTTVFAAGTVIALSTYKSIQAITRGECKKAIVWGAVGCGTAYLSFDTFKRTLGL